MNDLQELAETIMQITKISNKMFSTNAKLGNFNLFVFKTFLEEFVILFEKIFTKDVANEMPLF